jgi:hypothetical protein
MLSQPLPANPKSQPVEAHIACRSEIFVLIIAGSIPTLKPVWSKICGQVSTSNGYIASGSNKKRSSGYNSSSGAGGASQPSKKSQGFKARRPGSVTIALNEIDNITDRDAGSSTESILPRLQHAKEQHTASEQHASPINNSPPKHHHPSTSETTAPSQSIQIKQDFSVSHDKCEGPIPVVKQHYYFS